MDDARIAAELEVAHMPADELVALVYRLALRRPPEPDALREAAERLGAGTLSPAALLGDVVGSAEFEHVRTLDDAVARARRARAAGERPRGLRAPASHDERAIEIPWALSRLRGEAAVLDVGYAFAEPAWLAALTSAAAPGAVVGVDLAEREVPGIRGVRADVRELPFADGAFDVAFCISTLEHVGLDNRRYGTDAARDEGGRAAALRELRRVARRVLVSVPAGVEEDHGAFVQLPPEAWLASFRDAGLEVVEHETYERTPSGWTSTDGSPAVAYGSRGDGAAAVLCAELGPRRFRLPRFGRR
ncbi:MAG: class I SAM-dependent methyltransferase [Pseudomonadota bacterium]